MTSWPTNYFNWVKTFRTTDAPSADRQLAVELSWVVSLCTPLRRNSTQLDVELCRYKRGFMCMTLEMTYFHAELVQLIVSRSDSELEVQRNTAWRKIRWLLILSCWKMNCEWENVKNRPQTAEVGFLKTDFSFFFLNFEVSSVRFLEN